MRSSILVSPGTLGEFCVSDLLIARQTNHENGFGLDTVSFPLTRNGWKADRFWLRNWEL